MTIPMIMHVNIEVHITVLMIPSEKNSSTTSDTDPVVVKQKQTGLNCVRQTPFDQQKIYWFCVHSA